MSAVSFVRKPFHLDFESPEGFQGNRRLGFGGLCQLDDVDTVVEAVGDARGDLVGQPGLADAAGASERDKPALSHDTHRGRDFGLATDEAGQEPDGLQ